MLAQQPTSQPLAPELMLFAVSAPSLSRTLRVREQPLLGFGRVESLQGGSAKIADSPPSQGTNSSQSPQWRTLSTYEDIILALEKLLPSHAPALNIGLSAKGSGQFLPWTDSCKWTVPQKNGENKC